MHPLDTFQQRPGEAICYEYDASHMLHDIEAFPLHCEKAWSDLRQLRLPMAYRACEAVLFVGMGGSAIIGDMLLPLLWSTASIPFFVHRGYHLPHWVNPRTLVIASSHSGNTEETLVCVEQAYRKRACVLVLSTGGQLGVLAQHWKIPWISYAFAGQPRAAFGYSFCSLLAIATHLELIPEPGEALYQACNMLTELRTRINPTIPTEENEAKQLACLFRNRVPILYAGPLLAPVAHRWKNQLNENSQSWAQWDEIPELNHNTLMSYDHPDLWSHAIVVLLHSSHDESRITQRLHLTARLLTEKRIIQRHISAWGEDVLTQLLTMVSFSDYVSYYLAVLYQRDPSSIEAIDQLKQQLVEKNHHPTA